MSYALPPDVSLQLSPSALSFMPQPAFSQFPSVNICSVGGDNPSLNPRLPPLITAAKKMGFPKLSIASAIARGQGRSATGAQLQPMTIEALHTGTNVAVLVECQTDNKARTLQTVRDILKYHGAGEGSVEWMFERRGRVVFEKQDVEEEGGAWDHLAGAGSAESTPTNEGGAATGTSADEPWDEDHIVNAALEAGAMDVQFDEEDGREFTVFSEPAEVQALADAMTLAVGQAPTRTELAWIPRMDLVMVGMEEEKALEMLDKMLAKVEEEDDVVMVNTNRG